MALEETLKEFAERSRRKYTVHCAYQTLYLSLNKEDQKALDKAMKDGIPQSLIVSALRKEGHKASSDTMRTHVKGQCRCPKE